MNNLEKLAKGIGYIIMGAGLVCLVAVFGGTIIWLIWPVAIPAAFPRIVELHYLASSLTWWQSVLLTWTCAILIKGNASLNKSKSKENE